MEYLSEQVESSPSRVSIRYLPVLKHHAAPFLETERLTLCPLTLGHIDAMVVLDSDPEVMRYISNGIATPRAQYEERVPLLIRYMEANPGLGLWPAYLKQTGEFIGWYMLKHLPDNSEVEVGFRIRRPFWGMGLSTEAGHALLRHGFGTVGLATIAAIVHPDNLASQAVIGKIGLRPKGMATFHGIRCRYFELGVEAFGSR